MFLWTKQVLHYLEPFLKHALGITLLVFSASFAFRAFLLRRKEKQVKQQNAHFVSEVDQEAASTAPLLVNEKNVDDRNHDAESCSSIPLYHSGFGFIRYMLIPLVPVVLSGCQSGLLGVGSGTNFALTFLIFCYPYFDLANASATASAVMFFITAMMTPAYLLYMDLNTDEALKMVGIACPCSCVGTLLGSWFVIRFAHRKIAMYVLVSIVLLAVGIVVTVQGLILSHL